MRSRLRNGDIHSSAHAIATNVFNLSSLTSLLTLLLAYFIA